MKATTDVLTKLAKRIEAHRAKVAQHRDKIRALKEEIEELEINSGSAANALNDAKRSIIEAADELSKHA